MSSAIAQNVAAAGASSDMGYVILALYRSAAQPVMRDLARGLPCATAKPGLALIATEDSYCGKFSRAVPPSAPEQGWPS